MRFSPTSRVQKLVLRRRQRLEREKLPRFADTIADEQPATDSVIAARAVTWTRSQQDRRDQLAGRSSQLRGLLFSPPEPLSPKAGRHGQGGRSERGVSGRRVPRGTQ